MPYFTTTELRALPDLDRFPDARLDEAHDWIVSIIERECDTAFIPTTVTGERLTGSGLDGLRLRNAYVQSVTSVSVDGVAYTAPEVAALVVEDGYLYLSGTTWPTTARGNVTVTYVHGYSTTVPADLKQAALRAARQWLLTMDAWSGKDTRTTTLSTQDGTFQLSVAGEGRPTGVPDVDATIMAWARRVRVPRVA
jgi:hypothetical protein